MGRRRAEEHHIRASFRGWGEAKITVNCLASRLSMATYCGPLSYKIRPMTLTGKE